MFSLKRGDEDVDSLIESMLRLIEYMNQNPNFKKDIFNSFSTEDLQKIVKNMEEQNMSN
jgi:predicted CopG family antitoxin